MLENGSRESFMVQAFICTRMENTMKVNLEMVKRVERENFISSTKMFMKVIGLMINKMVLVNILTIKDNQSMKDIGEMELKKDKVNYTMWMEL